MLTLNQLNKKDFSCEVFFFQNFKNCKDWKKFIREGKVKADIFTPDIRKNVYAASIPHLKNVVVMHDLDSLLTEVQDILVKPNNGSYDDNLLLQFIKQKPSHSFIAKYFSPQYQVYNPPQISASGGYCMCFNCQSLRKNYLEVLSDSMSLDNPPCLCDQCRINREILKNALIAR